eukprot:SAG11_NODE_6394_length_1322_cov_1.587899_1_plen_156_part_10
MPTPAVQEYLDNVGSELHAWRDATTDMRIIDNLTRGQRAALHSLEQRHDVVVIEADKNLGLVLMDRNGYVNMGLEMLSESHVQMTNEEYDLWPTAPVEELAKAIIESTRTRYLAVLRKHKTLLDNWKDGPLHWKQRYLRRTAMRHPKNGSPYAIPN